MGDRKSHNGRTRSSEDRAKAARMASPASDLGARATNGGVAAKFAHFSNRVAILAGNYRTFGLMLAIVLVWAITGPLFKFSTTWQLVINTGTTIVTFLMVFLIQNTQNRDSLALHLKLDELIRAIDEADNRLMEAEDETDEELSELKEHYQHMAEGKESAARRDGRSTAGTR